MTATWTYISHSMSPPILTVTMQIDITAPVNWTFAIGGVSVNTGQFVSITGNPYNYSAPWDIFQPWATYDLSSLSVGSHTITFTINAGQIPYDEYKVAAGFWSPPDLQLSNVIYLAGMFTEYVYCFLPGTLIATPSGDRPVETLIAGDLILTADGRTVPIRFVGYQHIHPMFSDAIRSAPILITAGALGNGLPRRDLRVSANHALFLGGTLVHAAALVNGTTIRRETSTNSPITYYSIETERHELILAEGTPCETFMDHVPRTLWHNYADYKALYPHHPTIEELPYPRAVSARQVPLSVRRQIAAAVPVPKENAA